MGKKKIGIIVASVFVAAVVIIAGVFAFQGLNRKTLSTNIAVNKIPSWSKTVKPIAGWRVATTPSGTGAYQGATKTNIVSLTPSARTNKLGAIANSCQVLAQTGFLPAYQRGAGDLYLSKTYVYNQAQYGQTTLKNESTAWINSDQGAVEFVTGSYTGTITDSSTGASTSLPVSIMVASRAIDTLYANGAAPAPAPSSYPTTVPSGAASSKATATPQVSPTAGSTGSTTGQTGPYGSDVTKGVPILSVTYTCYNKKTSAAEFKNILAGLTAQL